MRVIICRYGIVYYNPLLEYYIDWGYIKNVLEKENYVVSSWMFDKISKLFKRDWVRSVSGRIKSKNDVKKLIKKIEHIEGITIPEKTQQKILDKSENVIALNNNVEKEDKDTNEELNDGFMKEYFNAPF